MKLEFEDNQELNKSHVWDVLSKMDEPIEIIDKNNSDDQDTEENIKEDAKDKKSSFASFNKASSSSPKSTPGLYLLII